MASPGRRRFLFRAVGALVGLLLAFVAGEIVARIGDLDDFRLELSLSAGAPPTLTYDERIGWRTIPRRGGTNRQGFRHLRDYTPERQRPGRIAIVGDSQVFGFYVEDDQHLGVLLDRQLDGVETYSFGVPGYGPAQEVLLLGEILEGYESDLVVAVPFLENDLIDATQEMAYGHLQKPYLEQGAEGWRVVNVPVPRPVRTGTFFDPSKEAHFLAPRAGLYRTSALYRAVVNRATALPTFAGLLSVVGLADLSTVEATAWGKMWSARRIDGREIPCWLLSMCPEEHWADGLEAMVAAHVEMARMCREADVPFVVLLTPSYTELVQGRFPMTEAFAGRMREKNVPLLDLTPIWASDWRRFNTPPPDYHWTPLGHRAAVAALVQHWRDRNP